MAEEPDKKSPRLQDVALLAGVSLTTASLALAGKGRISEAVRKCVLRTAEEIGYQVRESRRKPRKITAKKVGILTYTDESWSWTWRMVDQIINALDRIFTTESHVCSLIPVGSDATPQQMLYKIGQWDLDGVISIHYGEQDVFHTLEKSGIPVVVVMNGNFQDMFNSVCVDDFQGAYAGTRYLIEKGHRRIACIDYPLPGLPAVVADRYIGFRKAADEYSLKESETPRISCKFNNLEDIRARLTELLNQDAAPSALFAVDDYLSVKIHAILTEAGIHIPDDISILAPGEVLNYEEPHVPAMSTMSIDFTLMGRLAAEMLINKINHPNRMVSVVKVTQQLIERGSCRSLDE